MLKLELIILPLLAFLGPSNITNASTKTPIPSSQLSDAKTGVNYEFITIAANYVNGMWLVDLVVFLFSKITFNKKKIIYAKLYSF